MSKEAKMRGSKRLERIKNARSVNDVLDVVSEIAFELKNSQAVLKKLTASTSAGGGQISMDGRTGRRPAPTGSKVVVDGSKLTPAKTIALTKYVPPKLAELKPHSDLLDKLYDNATDLDAAVALIHQAFQGFKKSKEALKTINALQADVNSAIDTALASMRALASKHVPPKFLSVVDKVIDQLTDILPAGKHKSIEKADILVAPDKKPGSMQFCAYIGIVDLKNSQGFKYPHYYVMVTGIVDDKGAMVVFLNALPQEKKPGSYPLGEPCATSADILKRLTLIMALNDFVVDHERLPLPFDADRAKTSGIKTLTGVLDTDVVDDQLVVTLEPSVTDLRASNIRANVLARLYGIIGYAEKKADRGKEIFQVSKGTYKGKKALKFILTPAVGTKVKLDLAKLDDAALIMSFTDKQKAAMRFALQH